MIKKEYSFKDDAINEEEIINSLIDQMLKNTNISITKCFDDYLNSVCTKDIEGVYGVLGADRTHIEKYFYMKYILYKNIDSILFNTLKAYIYKFADNSKFINLKEELIDKIIKIESEYFYNNSIESKLKNIYEKLDYHTNIIANARLNELKNMLEPYKNMYDYYILLKDYSEISEKEAKCIQEVFNIVYSSIDILQKRGSAPNIEDILNLLDNTNKIYLYDFLSDSFIKELDFKLHNVTRRDIKLTIGVNEEETILLSNVCKVEGNKLYINTL